MGLTNLLYLKRELTDALNRRWVTENKLVELPDPRQQMECDPTCDRKRLEAFELAWQLRPLEDWQIMLSVRRDEDLASELQEKPLGSRVGSPSDRGNSKSTEVSARITTSPLLDRSSESDTNRLLAPHTSANTSQIKDLYDLALEAEKPPISPSSIAQQPPPSDSQRMGNLQSTGTSITSSEDR